MIQVDNISISYADSTPVSDFSMTLAKCEKAVITGSSGKGKTSILNALAGFVIPSAGSISVCGITISPNSIGRVRQQIAYLPQEISLDLPSGADLLYYPFSFRANKHIRPTQAQVQNMMHKLGLEMSLLDHTLHELSGGQKQRLALASVLFLNRPVLLLDEPTSALDPDSVDELASIIISLKDTTVLSVSHDRSWNIKMNRIIEL